MARLRLARPSALLAFAALFGSALAHDHHGGESHIDEGSTVSDDPIVRTTTAPDAVVLTT